jgi:hypothetical protein
MEHYMNLFNPSKAGHFMGEPSVTSTASNQIQHFEPADFNLAEAIAPFPGGWRSKVQHDALLCEATAITSALVDYLHGTLPTHPTADSAIRNRINNLISSLIKAGELVITYWKEAYRTDPDTEEEFEDRNQYWHFFCELRRIFSRIGHAINGQLYLINHEKNPKLFPKNTIKELTNLRYKLSSIIIEEVRKIRNDSEDKLKHSDEKIVVPWYQIALFYEYTIIVRRLQLSGSLDACRFAREHFECTKKSANEQKGGPIGGVAFNPVLFGEEPLKILMNMSEKISLSTQNAAAQGLELENPRWLTKLLTDLIGHTLNKDNNLKLSSLLHIESTVRVLSNNIVWNNVASNNIDEESERMDRFALSRRLLDFYNQLIQIIDENEEYDSWLRGYIKAKIRQDGGILLSNIMPVFLIDDDYENEESNQNDSQKTPSRLAELDLNKLFKAGWENEMDRPMEMRKRLRRALISDLIHRSNNFNPSSPPLLTGIESVLGIKPTKTNPFGDSTGFVQWLWGKEHSRHINQFPQSNINKAHISCLLAYLHCLNFHPDASTTGEETDAQGGFFSELGSHIDWYEDDKKLGGHWRIFSKQKARPQFTIGLFKGLENRRDVIERSRKRSENFKFNRSNLTRVNKMDALMYLANSLNLLEDLLFNEVGEKMLARINRASRTVDMNSTIIENSIHIHDVLHLASQADQNPMRIWASTLEDGIYESAIDRIFRASFARLYALSRKTEVLARVIKERPLRQPYQSSAVLIIDQISVLLKFLHTDWLNNEETTMPGKELDQEEYSEIVQFLDDEKRFPVRNQIRHTSADRKVYKFKTDVSTEFQLSNMLTRRDGKENIRGVLQKSKEKLRLSDSLNGWEELFNNALALNYDGVRPPNEDEVDDVKKVMDDTTPNAIEGTILNELHAVKAFNSIQSNSKREWILWARLAFFPHLIDGQIMKSSTLASSKKSKNVNQALIFHTLKEAFEQDFVE